MIRMMHCLNSHGNTDRLRVCLDFVHALIDWEHSIVIPSSAQRVVDLSQVPSTVAVIDANSVLAALRHTNADVVLYHGTAPLLVPNTHPADVKSLYHRWDGSTPPISVTQVIQCVPDYIGSDPVLPDSIFATAAPNRWAVLRHALIPIMENL